RNFFLISCVVLCEPISSTMLLPFVYFMVKDFGYAEEKIGSRAGIITSCFFVVQMFSTPLWSMWSNRAGRKVTLLTGLFFTAVGMVLFGLSRSLVKAILARSFCGLLNGNFPVARTMVGELAEKSGTDKGKAFSLFGFTLAAGWLLGPMIGGGLARPAIQFGVSGPKDVFVHFPYLLPCLCGGLINLVVFVASWCLLEDTKPSLPKDVRPNSAETDPLLDPGQVEEAGAGCTPNSGSPSVSNRRVYILCLVSVLFFFTHAILFDELFSLFTAYSLSFEPGDIASALIVSGPAMLISMLGFPPVHKRVSSLQLYRWSSFVFVIIYPLFSLVPHVKHAGNGWVWASLVILIALRYSTLVVSLTSVNILV
ncbi:uncharacterized protein K452DRAFT_211043, partial [Aplosporella prunicola CBS 121167]